MTRSLPVSPVSRRCGLLDQAAPFAWQCQSASAPIRSPPGAPSWPGGGSSATPVFPVAKRCETWAFLVTTELTSNFIWDHENEGGFLEFQPYFSRLWQGSRPLFCRFTFLTCAPRCDWGRKDHD